MITVWKCTSPTTGETAILVHSAYPDDFKFQHAFQVIVYRGLRAHWNGVA